ncbi:hypothetical protein KPH14_009772, partial [Odynerus spinipes]
MITATQSIPRFIQEITDAYVKEGEKVVFECTYSGNPAPDVVWYKNDKLIMNTENLKIRIRDEEKKTSLTVQSATREDDAVYVCKATSEIGLAITKAKLRVTDTGDDWRPMSEDETEEVVDVKQKKEIQRKKRLELRKAKESKIKAERVKVDKKEIVKEKPVTKEQPEDKTIADIEETQVLESATTFEEETKEVSRAKKIVPIQEPVITEATASLKKIDDKKPRETITPREKAKPVIEERESTIISEVRPRDVAPDFTVERITDRATEVTAETLETFSVSEVRTETGVQEVKRVETKQKKTKKITQGQAEITQVKTEEIVEEKPKKKKKGEKIRVREEITVEEILETEREHIAREVEEILEVLQAKEFGPGETPLRELATIGYLVRQGVSVTEINESLYTTDKFPALRTPDAQNALIQLVEREGHGPLITQVLTEETTTDESIVAATIGFRAFMRMIELQHATVEEVITHFVPEDFRPRAWEVTEVTEVETEQHVMETIDAVHKTEVHIMERRDERKAIHMQDIRDIKEYKDTRQAHTTLRKRKDRKPKDQIEDKPEDRDEGVEIVEIEEIQEIGKEKKKKDIEEVEEEIIVVEKDSKGKLIQKKEIDDVKKKVDVKRKDKKEKGVEEEEEEEEEIIRKRKELKTKRPAIGEDQISLEEVEEFEITRDKSMPSVILNIPGQLHEIIPLTSAVEQAPGKPKAEKAQFTVDTVNALTEHLQPVQEKEIDSVSIKKPVEQKASVSLSTVEPYSTTETNIQATAGEFVDTFKPSTYAATPGVTPSESLVVSEILPNDADLPSLKLSKSEDAKTADTSLILQEATTISETMVSQNEVPTEDFVSPLAVKAEDNFLPQVGLSVYEIQEGVSEDKFEPIKTVLTKPRVNVTTTEPILVEEVRAEDKPGKYYPELIVPTEVATQSVIAQKQRVTEELHAPEKEGEYIPGKLPPSQKAQVAISYGNETAIVQQNLVQESEGVFIPDRKADTFEATDKITLLEGVTVSTVDTQQRESDLKIEENKMAQADLNIIEITSAMTVETITSEKEQDYRPDEKPATKLAETSISTLEIGSVTSTMVQESEGLYTGDHKPTLVLAESSVRPEEHVLVSEVHTADYPSDFKDELKYVSESGNVSMELTEAKIIHETLTHDKESKLEEPTKPEERVIETSYDAMRSVEVFQTTSVEKEAELKIFELPESHHGKTVPTHPVVSLQIEETHPEGNVGEVIKEIPSSAKAEIGAISLQETVVKETIPAEGLAPVQEDKISEISITSEHIPLISLIQSQPNIQESEDQFQPTLMPENKTANVGFEYDRTTVTISQMTSVEKESVYIPEEQPSKHLALVGIDSTHGIAETITITTEDSVGDVLIKKPDMKTAIPTQDEQQSLLITQDISQDQEEPFEEKFKPISHEIQTSIEEGKPITTVMEINISDKEDTFTTFQDKSEEAVPAIIAGHKVAEKTEIVTDLGAGKLDIIKPTSATAQIGQKPYETIQLSEEVLAEKEIDTVRKIPLPTTKAHVTLDENRFIAITEATITQDVEEELPLPQKPSEKTAQPTFDGKEVAEHLEVNLREGLGTLPEVAKPIALEAHSTQSTLESLNINETIPQEQSIGLPDKLELDKHSAQVGFVEEQSIIIGTVVTQDKEDIMTVPEYAHSKAQVKLTQIGRDVAETSELLIEQSTGSMKPFEKKEMKAHPTQDALEPLIIEDIPGAESEGLFDKYPKTVSTTANTVFEEDHSISITEVTSSEIETSLQPKELATSQTASSTIITEHGSVETTLVESQVNIPEKSTDRSFTPQKATALHDTFESIIVEQKLVEESEKTFEGTFKPSMQKADIDFEKNKPLQISEIITEDKEDVLSVAPKHQEVTATSEIGLLESVQKSVVEGIQSVGEIHEKQPISSQATLSQIPVEAIIKTETTVGEREDIFEGKDFKPTEQKGKPQLEALSTVSVTEIISNEIEETLPESKAPKEHKVFPNLISTEAIETLQIVTAGNAEEITKHLQMEEKQTNVEIEELSSVFVSEIILNETEDTLLHKEAPKDYKAQLNISGREAAETTEVMISTETEDLSTKKPKEEKGKPRLEELTSLTVSQIVSNEAEESLPTAEKPSEKVAETSLLGRDIAQTSEVLTMISTDQLVSAREPEKHKGKPEVPKEEKGKPQLEGLSTVSVTEIISNEIEETLPESKAPKEHKVFPNLISTEAIETLQVVTSGNAEEITKHLQMEEKQTHVEIEELSGVLVSEIIINETEETLLRKEMPKDYTAQLNISGREAAETTEVMISTETEDLSTKKPKEEKGKPGLEELTPLTVSQIVSNEAEETLPTAEKPSEKVAETSLLGRDIAQTSEVLAMISTDQLVSAREPEKHKGTPGLEELSSLTVSQIVSHEAEETLPSPEVPTEREAQPNIFGRDIAQTTQVLTVSSVEQLAETKAPDQQKGKPSFEELSSVTVSQTLYNEMEDEMPVMEKLAEKTAQPSLIGRDAAETTEVVTLSTTEELSKLVKPEQQKGKPQFEELSSLSVSQIVSQESENVLPSPEVPSSLTAKPSLSGREIAETSEVMTVSNVEELGKPEVPKEEKGKPQLEGLSTVSVTEIISSETGEVLPASTAPKEQQVQPSLLSAEAIETLQVVTSGNAEEITKHLKMEEKQTNVEIEELSGVLVSEIIINETEETLLRKEMPKDYTAQLNISGREVAETSEVTITVETEELSTKLPKEEKGKPGLEELTPLTVSQIVSNEAEENLPATEKPSEKIAEPNLLGRDIAQTSQVFTMASAEQLISPQEPEKQKGKPGLEELSSLTVSQIVSHEAEETLPSPEVPTERAAQPNIFGRDIAQTTQVLTVSSVEQLAETKAPDQQKGKPSFEELSSVTVSQTLYNEMEDEMPVMEKLAEKTAQPSLTGRDAAETTEILTMTSAEEFAKLIKPEQQKGEPQFEELTSLSVSQVVSHETENVLPSPEVPSSLTAKPSLSGREVAETSEVLSVSNVEELGKPDVPKEQRGKPHFEELTSVSVYQIISNESEEVLMRSEKPDEKIAKPQLSGREVAEKTEVLTVSNVEELPKLEKPESQQRKLEVEEFTSLVISEVVFNEAEKTLPSPDAPTERKAFPHMLSVEAAEISEVLTVTNVDDLQKSKLPEEQKVKPMLEELSSLSISEVSASEIETGLPTPEEPTKQIAQPSLFGIQVAQKSQVITSQMTETLAEMTVPETKTIKPEQIPYESFEEIQMIPQESERNLIIEKTTPLATAEVTFRTSESVEVTQIMTTEKETKQEVKETIKEASALSDVVKTEVVLKTEIQVEDTALELKISKPESKKARELEEPKQGIIVTELETTGECESVLPESVMPLTKVANISIEADRLKRVIETTEAPVQHHTTITSLHKTKHDITQQPSFESDTEVTEEYTTKFRRGSKDEDTAAIKTKKTIIRKKKPAMGKEEENVVVIEEELENIKSSLPQIPKKQFMPIEEVTDDIDQEEIIPSKIEEIEDTPLEETRKPVQSDTDLPLEEENKNKTVKKPKHKQQTPTTAIEDNVQVITITTENITTETPENIIEIIETPTTKIIKRKKQPAKKDQPAVITQEV